VDVGDPDAPRRLSRVAVPGTLVGIVSDDQLLTLSYTLRVDEDSSRSACRQALGRRGHYDGDRCEVLEETLHLVRITGDHAELQASYALDTRADTLAVAIGDERVFVGRSPSVARAELAPLIVLGTKGGMLTAREVRSPLGDDPLIVHQVLARGDKALVTQPWAAQAFIVDASDLDAVELRSAGLEGEVWDLAEGARGALCAARYDGVIEVEL